MDTTTIFHGCTITFEPDEQEEGKALIALITYPDGSAQRVPERHHTRDRWAWGIGGVAIADRLKLDAVDTYPLRGVCQAARAEHEMDRARAAVGLG